jgi:hypothetical protein
MKADKKSLDELEGKMDALAAGNVNAFIRLACYLLLWIARFLWDHKPEEQGNWQKP